MAVHDIPERSMTRASLTRAFEAVEIGRAAPAGFEPLNQACALFRLEPKNGLENKLHRIRTLLGHDNRVRGTEYRTMELSLQLVHGFH
jgi:hypothetical protein